MLSEIRWIDFKEWAAFYELDPFDNYRDDLRTASIVAAIRNLFAKDPKPITDFLLRFDTEYQAESPKEQTVSDQWAIAKQWAMVSKANLARKAEPT